MVSNYVKTLSISKLDSKSFKFNDIDFIIYPIDTLKKSFLSMVKYIVYKYRISRLSHRSTQEMVFDSMMIDLNYPGLTGHNFSIIPEVAVMNTDWDRSNPDSRMFYVMDYFIHSKSLCIELDSGLHDATKDGIKDEYMNSLGIKVHRVKDFLDNISKSIRDITEVINNTEDIPEDKRLNLDYSYISDEANETFESLVLGKIRYMDTNKEFKDIYDKVRSVIKLTPKKALNFTKLCLYDKDLLNDAINGVSHKVTISLDEIFLILPMTRKEKDKYNKLIGWLNNLLGVTLEISSHHKDEDLNKES